MTFLLDAGSSENVRFGSIAALHYRLLPTRSRQWSPADLAQKRPFDSYTKMGATHRVVVVEDLFSELFLVSGVIFNYCSGLDFDSAALN